MRQMSLAQADQIDHRASLRVSTERPIANCLNADCGVHDDGVLQHGACIITTASSSNIGGYRCTSLGEVLPYYGTFQPRIMKETTHDEQLLIHIDLVDQCECAGEDRCAKCVMQQLQRLISRRLGCQGNKSAIGKPQHVVQVDPTTTASAKTLHHQVALRGDRCCSHPAAFRPRQSTSRHPEPARTTKAIWIRQRRQAHCHIIAQNARRSVRNTVPSSADAHPWLRSTSPP